jgi:hypothetical protein
MKKTFLLIALGAIAAFTEGCRREDFRRHVFEIPGMTPANTNAIKEAIFVYEGVDMNSLEFDLEKKTLEVRFDSMKIAQTNIRAAIEEKGIEVKYPEKSGKSAGYINKRDKEVK